MSHVNVSCFPDKRTDLEPVREILLQRDARGRDSGSSRKLSAWADFFNLARKYIHSQCRQRSMDKSGHSTLKRLDRFCSHTIIASIEKAANKEVLWDSTISPVG
jgi:hypothetical protein